MDNQVNDAQNNATLANTAAVQTDVVNNDSLILKNEDIKSKIPNLEPDNEEDSKNLSHIKSFNEEEEDKSESKSDDDSDYDIDEEDDEEYIDPQISQKLQMKSSKESTSQKKRIVRNSKHKRQPGVILERWNRETDRDMFQYLGNLLKQRNMDLQEFIFDDAVKITNDINKIVLWDIRLEILEQAMKKFKWNNTSYFLFKRLRKIAENQHFSFREAKLLSKI